MGSDASVSIRFPELELGDAGKAANSLREEILYADPGAIVDLVRDDPTNQDFGATLIALVGTPAVLAIAKGIAVWIGRKRTTVVLEIDGDKVRLEASGTIDANAARMIEAFSKK